MVSRQFMWTVETHLDTKCHSPLHCVNFEEAYFDSDKNCFYFRCEKDMLSGKTKKNINYSEVKLAATYYFLFVFTLYGYRVIQLSRYTVISKN